MQDHSKALKPYAYFLFYILASLTLCFAPLSIFAKASKESVSHERLNSDDYFKPVYPQKNHPKLGFIIAKRLEYQHYLGTKLDDELSKQAYKAYIKSLDPTRSIFNQKEIDQKCFWPMGRNKNWSLCALIRKMNDLTVLHSMSMLSCTFFKENADSKLEHFLSTL